MSRISIKLRVTLWYTLLFIFLMVAVVGFMMTVSKSVIRSYAEGRLQTVIGYNVEEVEYDDGELEIETEDFDIYKDGVYSIVYDSSGALVYGSLPLTFTVTPPFGESGYQWVASNNEDWLVYDRLVLFSGHDPVWIRGILPLNAVSGVLRTVFRVSWIALPLLALFAAVGGYWITGRAFLPVRLIRRTVESIQEGKDLSRRVPLSGSRDEIHELAQTCNRMLARLEDSFEAEKTFTADVSHELRTPVSVILAQCEYAAGAGHWNKESLEFLNVFQRQANRMSRLITQLLTLTRLEQGTAAATFEEVNLSGMLHSLCDEQILAVVPKGMFLRTDIEAEIRASIDIVLFTRLLENLLQNAYKYGKSGGAVSVSLRKTEGRVCLAVSDNGVGIAPQDQEKIWRRFFQVDASRSSENGSMGLGLAMVRQIAALHHGEVLVESALGKGSTFTFSFPLR